MPNLYEILADAQHGDAMAELGQQFGLSPQQTQAAVASLLPAISMGLKRSTATPEGLGNLFALVARRPDLYAAYDDPLVAFSPEARDAGNTVLSTMFGSPDASRAIAGQAQQLSGISSAILKKLLPIIVGMIISGLMRSGSGRAAPQAPQPTPQPAPEQGGGLIDILRQIFGQGQAGDATNQPGSGSSPYGIPPIGDILGTDRGGTDSPQKVPPMPMPSDQPAPRPTDAQHPARIGEGDPRGPPEADRCRPLRDRHSRTVWAGRLRPTAGAGWGHSWPDLARSAQGRPRTAAEARCGRGGVRRSARAR
jgi:hypothetical protein